jgi:hypothetical protein
MNTSHEVSTKVEAGAASIETNLTVNWDGMEQSDILALAAQSLIIKWQGRVRKEGEIPTEASINAVDHKIGVRAPRGPVNLVSAFEKLSPDERAAMLAKLTASLQK